MSEDKPLVVVAGGGITGLATAWHLQQSGAVRVVVVESADHLGGKLATAPLAGTDVDAGPDCFLARVPWATDLCREVGLDDLVPPATGTAFIWSGRKLHRLPDGLVLGVPTSTMALARSRLLSPGAALRAAIDLTARPYDSDNADPSVAEIVGARLGRGVVDQIVEPLLGGINAGVADRLSLRSVAPQIADAALANRSLIAGLRAQRKANPPADGPIFLAPRAGMGALVTRLEERLRSRGVEIRTGTAIEKLTPAVNGRVNVFPTGLFADHVVLTAPAYAAAELVRPHTPRGAEVLDTINYASIAIVLLAYRAEECPTPNGSGFLVPRRAGRLLTACSFMSNKWPHLAPPGHVVLRCSVGHIDDNRGATLDDGELIDGAHADVRAALRLKGDIRPADAVVVRWPRSFPQYEPGHAASVARIKNYLAAELPGITLAGAAYDGLGLAACARQGAEAARQTLASACTPRAADGR